MGARWISYLRKRELEAILKEFSLEATGTVEEMRSRLSAFNNRDDHVLEIAERLQDCEAEITAALTDRKQRSPTPYPHPPGPTQLQVPALEGRGAADVVGDTEIHPVKREIFPRKSEMSAATLAEKLKNWGITFDGTTDPITFIQHLEERATAHEVDVEKMPQAIPGLLTDTAEHWFRTSQLLGKSWTNFKKAFLDFFLPPRYFQRLEDERVRDPSVCRSITNRSTEFHTTGQTTTHPSHSFTISSSSGEQVNGAELQSCLQELCPGGSPFSYMSQSHSPLLLGLWSQRSTHSRVLPSYPAGKREESSPELGEILQVQSSRNIAQVQIEGQEFNATIDTGASRSFVSERVVQRVGTPHNVRSVHTHVRNNLFRRNHATVSAEPVEEGRAPSPVRPGYTPDTGGALAAITANAEQEELEPWVNKFLQEELAKFEGLTGVSNIAEHTITMRDDKPIKQRYFPKNPAMQRIIDEQIDELLRNDCIEPSRSPHSAPIVLVGKKSGEMRLCVDFRQLNAHSIPDAYPLPRITHIWERLRHAKYISTLDLKSGYWQIPVAESSRECTAFTVPRRGLYHWKMMPFGLHSAPATFQRALDSVIGPDMEPNAFAYLDDIIIIGRTLEEHVQHLQEVFRRLRKANLRLNAKKCSFFKRSLVYLGHVISEEGIHTDPDKISAVRGLSPPTTCKELRRFVPNFASVVQPMSLLLKKGKKWQW
ncbi:uncharacterized protein [Drosophila suzukii]|uniref:Reverse transcriptase domain-containing protein n=1 Tax=Drosophila suzukii TaxID=28584 RepID=A0ABM4TVS3_DROSZ